MDRFVDVTRKFEPRKPANFIAAWEEINFKGYTRPKVILNTAALQKGEKISIFIAEYKVEEDWINTGLISIESSRGVGSVSALDYGRSGKNRSITIELEEGVLGPVYLDFIIAIPNGFFKKVVVTKGETPLTWEDIYGTEDEVSTQNAINMQTSDNKGIMGGGVRQFLIPGSPLLVSVSPKKGGQHEQGQIRNHRTEFGGIGKSVHRSSATQPKYWGDQISGCVFNAVETYAGYGRSDEFWRFYYFDNPRQRRRIASPRFRQRRNSNLYRIRLGYVQAGIGFRKEAVA